MKKEHKVTEEQALEEFESWADLNDIDIDTDAMDEDDKKSFLPLRERVVKAVMEGRAVFDGASVEYTLSDAYDSSLGGMKIKIAPPTGKVFLGQDGCKENQEIRRLHGMMSAMTGQDVGVFSKLLLKDWKFCQSVLMLFLSA